MAWEVNRDSASLPAISVGDIVHLRQSSGLGSLVQAIVSGVNQDKIHALVNAAFDSSGQRQITNGEPSNLVGSTLSFNRQVIHKVIKHAEQG
jgi:hypothetical protein